MKGNALIILIIILLAAANVYQHRNPKVVEVPAGQEQIDKDAWVQRSAYVSRGILLDSLHHVNEEMARRIRNSRDRIANLTNINGRLNLEVDSLETVSRLPLFSLTSRPLRGGEEARDSASVPLVLGEGDTSETLAPSRLFADTSYNFISVFGNGLFRVDSEVKFLKPSKGIDPLEGYWVENNLDLTQLRDIEISVVNTMNDDRSRLLTYVTSPDFETLEYQTYTELKRKKRWPWFLIGVGVGVTGSAILIN